METRELKIIGMSCGGCVKSVTNVLQALPGVEKVDIALESGRATVRFDPAKVGETQFRAAVADAGFELAA